MSEMVQDIIQNLQSNLEIKNENVENQKFSVKIKFNWSGSNCNVEIIGNGEEVIVHEDDDDKISKDEFIVSLVNELKTFALLHIHVEIEVIDCELNSTIFHTKSCASFRDKVIDLTGCSFLNMLHVPIPKYKADFYFYVPSDPLVKNYFITGSHSHIAAENTLSGKLEMRGGFDLLSFICYTPEEIHNSLKKCIECAIDQLYSHCRVIKEILNFDKTPTKKPSQRRKDLVDLTYESDSDIEECHIRLLNESNEEFFCDTVASDDDDDRELKQPQNIESFHNWELHLGQLDDHNNFNDEYKDDYEKSEIDDLNVIADTGKPIPKKIVEQFDSDKKSNGEVKEKLRMFNQQKLSFSSTAYTQMKRKSILIDVPEYQPSKELRSRPKINRDKNDISLTSTEKSLPKSKLYDKEELGKHFYGKKLPLINEREKEIHSGYTNNERKFVIPKNSSAPDSQYKNKSTTVFDGHYDTPTGPQPRSQFSRTEINRTSSQTSIHYTEDRRARLNPTFVEKFHQRVQNLKPLESSPETVKQEDHSTPQSLKTFFDNSAYISKSKHHDVEEDDNDDDDVMIVDENLHENKNVRAFTKEPPKIERPRKFFKHSHGDRHSKIQKFSHNRQKPIELKKEDNETFYIDENDD